MIKLYVFLDAAPGADPFRYRGAAALSELHRTAPTAVEYVQTRTFDRQLSDDPPPFAGVAELRFDYAAPAVDAAANVARLAGLWADGVRAAGVVVGHERTIMRLPGHVHGQGVKGVFPFDRKPGLGIDYFQTYWWRTHGPIAARTEQALAYFQCHPLRHLYDDGAPAFDGVTELHWPDFATAEAAMASRQMREDQSQDARNFADPDSVRLFLAAEEVVQPQ
ncbi:MAG: EthD domain-containing protein [Gammaproteobacteria bacterium]|nr:EthD domain-containing protein [Gammaproteobacteria bacterium]